jgi:cytokinin dehydrogenase
VIASHLEALRALPEVEVDVEATSANDDFGHLRSGSAWAVVRPRTIDAVARVVEAARRDGFRLTSRGLGLSQSGQSIPRDGVSLQTSALADIAVDPDARLGRCGPGATWRQLLAATAPHGLAPRVMPFNLDLSIGGTLSAGGLGSTSHHHGFAVSAVRAIEAVSGTAEHVVSTPTTTSTAYDAMLGGVGRFGVLCSATIELRRMLPFTRTYCLLYDSIEPMLDDERALMSRPWCTHLEGFASAAIQGLRRAPDGRRAPFARWFFGMHLSVEHDGAPSADAEYLAGLGFRELLNVEEDRSESFAARYDVRFAMMRATGAWDQIHPWVEGTLPGDAAPRLLAALVPTLPLLLGDGHRIMPIADVPRPALLMLAEPAPAFGLAVLPAGVPRAFEAPVVAAAAGLHRKIVESGGKRYLSGWLFDPDDAFWRSHYGGRYDAWRDAKTQLDPDGVFESSL